MPSPTAPSDTIGDRPVGGLLTSAGRSPFVGTRRSQFGAWVFGPELGPRRPLGRTALVILAMLVIGVVVTVYRLPADQRNVLWAEDGTVFIADAFQHGYLSNLFAPYAGYMHLVPRTAAQLVAWLFPLEDVGRGMNLFGAAVWSTVAVAAFAFTRDRLQLPLRWLLWLLVLLVPIGSMEVATNVANSHWFLMFGLFLALSARSGSGILRLVFASVLVAAAVLSDPLSLLFAPLVLARLITLPRNREQIVTIVFAAAAAIQLLVDIGTQRDRGEPALQPGPLGGLYLIRVAWGNFVGAVSGSDFYHSVGREPVLFIAGAGLLALVVFIVLRWRRTALAAIALICSAGFYGVVAVLTWQSYGLEPLGVEVYWGGRYSLVPTLLLITSVVAALSAWLPSSASRHRIVRVVALVVVSALLIAPGIINFRTPAYKAGGVQMSAAIDRADDLCELNPAGDAELQIAPKDFEMLIPCDEVLTAR